MKVAAPVVVKVPSTIRFSLTFTVVESSELILVPVNLSAPIFIAPVPLAFMFTSSLDLVPVMLLSLIVTAGKTTEPVPPGVKIMSAFELEPMVLSLNVILSMVVVPTKLVAPVTFSVERVVSPDGTASVEPRSAAPVSVDVPVTFNVPSTISPSLMLIVVESSELKEVPCILIAPKTTEPVPLGRRLISSFDLVPTMLLSSIFMAGN